MRKHRSKRLTALVLALVLCLSLVVPVGAVGTSGGTNVRFEQVDNSVVSATLRSNRVQREQAETPLYQDTDMVRVSIVLSGKSTIEKGFATMDIAENSQAMAYRDQLQAQQETVASRISKQVLGGKKLDVVWNLTLAANIISANVPYGDIEAIKAVSGVEDVVLETRYEPAVVGTDPTDPNMATSSSMIGSSAAWAEGYTGAGSRIAIIDTGTDTDHQSFDAKAFEYAIAEDAKEAGKEVSAYNLLTAAEIADKLDQLNISGKNQKWSVSAEDAAKLYVNSKLAFGYNYIDKSFDITHDGDTQGEHGSHVAGIATANRYIATGEDTYGPALEVAHTQGVAPDAQLLTMKVFGKGGGAYDSDYMAAIEDAIVLNCDSVNLSLGSGNPGMSTNALYQKILSDLEKSGTVVCMSAGNSGYWVENSANGIPYLYSDDVSFQTDGAPGSYTNSLAVASVDNAGQTGNYLDFSGKTVFFSETSGGSNAPIATMDKSEDGSGTEYKFVLFENTGVDGDGNSLLTDYADDIEGKVVMVYRGTSSFYQKHDAVAAAGGVACIVVNNQAGTINMDLSDSKATIPCVSITLADGKAITAAATAVTNDSDEVLYYTGTVTVSGQVGSALSDSEYDTMSSFSSWGVPGSLQLKPEITAPGGNIYSVNGAVEGGKAYENMSGTSMAAPQVTGMVAVLAQYLRENGLAEKTGISARHLAQSLLMSTAEPLVDGNSGSYYPVLQQGAGLANVNSAIQADSYLTMAADATSGATDGKVKVELGDDPAKTGEYTFAYTLTNLKDEAAYYLFDTDVFTQDLFADSGATYLDTWTIELPAEVSYKVDDALVEAGSGYTDADVQTILDYASGKGELDEAQLTAYDLDGDGKVTTYDAHLAMNLTGNVAVKVPAGGSIAVEVTVKLSEDVKEYLDTYYTSGAYIEAYSYAKELSTEEGVQGTTHSIPVLGFYGNWSKASMYDVGSLPEFWYELETRKPYLPDSSGDPEMFNNYMTIQYAGDPAEYFYFANPLAEDDEYLPERNAFNNSNGDTLAKYYFSPIRNAGGAIWQVTNAETGEPYYRSEDLGSVSSAYYYTNGSKWLNTTRSLTLGWQGTDEDGEKLPEGTEVNVSLVLAPEYYASADGSYDWNALTDGDPSNGELGEGAYLTTRTAIDNNAPTVKSMTLSEDGKLTVVANDNRYLAVVALYQRNVEKEVDYVAPNQALTEKGQDVEAVLDVSKLEKGAELYVQVTDYAMNQSTYKLVLGENVEPQDPTKITVIPGELTLVKGTSAALTVDYEPWIVNEGVTWASSNEDVATVDANGVVTGVGEGTATITACSTANPAITNECTVTVKTYPVTLVGALQDKDGNPLLFTWNMEKDKTWTKYAALENDMNAATYDFAHEDGPVYQMNTSGYLHKVNLETGETIASSESTVAYGAAMDDMEYAAVSSLSAERDILVGVYGGFFLYSDPAMGNSFDMGWDMGSYLAQYANAKNFTAVAWAGSDTNKAGNTVDVFYCMTDSGTIWVMEPDFTTGNASMGYVETDLKLDWPGYDGAYYCSMVLGDDGNLYLSYFNGTTNQIYILEYDEKTESFVSTLLGDVGDGVWPCALLAVADNNAGTGGDTGDGTDALRPARNLPADVIEAEAASSKLTLSTASQVGGSLNAVKVADSTAKNAAVKAPIGLNSTDVSGLTTVTLDVTAEDSTNGKLTFAYYADTLTLVSVNTERGIMSSYNDADGQLTFAYAAETAVTGQVATLTFSYDQNTCPNSTDVIATTLEDGGKLDLAEKETITFKLRNTVVIPGGSDTPSTPAEPAAPELPFTDVTTDHPFYEDIKYVYEKGLMQGVSEDIFQSATTTTRGMIATILYRMEGEPAVKNASSFRDVADGMYYSNAVAWAAANGIVNGYADGTFQPDQTISREQMAAILYRYAQYKGCDVSVGEDTNILSYTDATQVAEYAIPAFQWAVGAGIINGTTASTLSPKGSATRGQVAAILHRYCEWIG